MRGPGATGKFLWSGGVAAVALVPLLLWALGGPAGLDAGMRDAASRGCVSLAERRVVRSTRIVEGSLDGRLLDLDDDPAGFYETLAEIRGPDDFPLDALRDVTRTRAQALSERCRPGSADRASSTEGGASGAGSGR